MYFQILRRKYIIFTSQYEEKEVRVESKMFSKRNCVLWLAELVTELWLHILFFIPTQAIIFYYFSQRLVFKWADLFFKNDQQVWWSVCLNKYTKLKFANLFLSNGYKQELSNKF